MPKPKADAYPYVAKANQYARDVVEGTIDACKWVKLACQRHLDDLEASTSDSYAYRYDPEKGNRVCAFAELMPHVKGKWAGKRVQLEPWQCFLLAVPFGWVRKSDGMRRFREIYCEVPRKNGKSFIAATIGLYMLTMDGEAGAEVYSGATSEKQAWEVFRPAKLMAARADRFAESFGVQVNASNIHVMDTASRFEPLIGKPGDGASPSCAIVDEYHEHPTAELYDTMITGMGARSQPMMLVITTAGSNTGGPCYDKRDQVTKILSGVFEADDVFGIIYGIDEADEWTDLNVWKKANPNFGVSIFEDFLAARLEEAKQRASRQNIIKTKHLNVWTTARAAWMEMEAWRKCGSDQLSENDFWGETCYIGLDLSSKTDMTAVVKVFPKMMDGKLHYYVFGRYYLPEAKVMEPNNHHYQGWHIDQHLIATDGNEIDISRVIDDIRQDCKRFAVAEIAYDPWGGPAIKQELERDGIRMVQFNQSTPNYSPAMKETEGAILAGRLHHDNNPVLTWMMGNVVVKPDRNDNIFPNKERDENKIDGAQAMFMGIARAEMAEGGASIYESRGLLIL